MVRQTTASVRRVKPIVCGAANGSGRAIKAMVLHLPLGEHCLMGEQGSPSVPAVSAHLREASIGRVGHCAIRAL